uniref:Exo-alpha-sialidase n=1 Tax=Angiostrongylus cantonensis TaxID=6313 RepID=A0A0K0DAV7_ANGCA
MLTGKCDRTVWPLSIEGRDGNRKMVCFFDSFISRNSNEKFDQYGSPMEGDDQLASFRQTKPFNHGCLTDVSLISTGGDLLICYTGINGGH